MSERYLIVGLGNPGRKYAGNRHNVGFQTVDYIATRHGIRFSGLQSKAAIATGTMQSSSVILAKPQDFMNRSGRPVRALVDFYKIPIENIMVIYDEIDLPTGTIRIRPEGGSGGQNGVKDIINHLNTQSFARMRIGVERPPGKMDPAAYVLRDFDKDQQPIIEETYSRAADAVETWLTDGIQLAMSRHNGPASQD